MTTILDRLRKIAGKADGTAPEIAFWELRDLIAELDAAPAGAQAEPAASCIQREAPLPFYEWCSANVPQFDRASYSAQDVEANVLRLLRECWEHVSARPAGEAGMPVVAKTEHQAGIIRDLRAIAVDRDGDFWPTMLAAGALSIIEQQQRDAHAAIASRDALIVELQTLNADRAADLVEERNRTAAMRVEWGAEAAALTAQARHAEDVADAAKARIAKLEAKLNTPQLHDFAAAVVLEAAHQRERWGVSHDVGKQPSDWFWLVGYLAGKALHAATSGNQDKTAHHTISTAAALANWHAHVTGEYTGFRPGIDPVARGIEPPHEPTPTDSDRSLMGWADGEVAP